jgi:hypothetical protein
VLVCMGENLHWPLMKDERIFKLKPTHYVLSLPILSFLDESTSSNNFKVFIT